ncbi:hypothetical protein CRG98_022615 [Punica granatum]|uniref:Uncharacterized protein n=1 Tax=Punica granatum TaxID=22663 RepID=A0A2I0JL37_PUNGR|nr:hypothetical protein CRG98_022615 [Punica granatum]
MRGGWSGWMASGHSTSRHGEMKTAGGLPAKQANGIEPEPTKYVPSGVAKLYGPKCGLSSGPASRAFGSRGLGMSTFPWGYVTDTREKESPLIILRLEYRGPISYPSLGAWNT